MDFYNSIEEHGEKTAIICGDIRLSYRDLAIQANSFSSLINKRCLVFIICKNNISSIVSYIGCLRNKIVPLLLKESIDDGDLDDLISLYRPSYICNVDGSIRETGFDNGYEIFDDLAVLLTTSGSTGSKKVVRLSYKNINSNAIAISKYLDITENDNPITSLPMNYAYGLSVIQSHFLKGASIVLSSSSFLDKNFWKDVNDKNVTSISGVPYMFETLKKIRFRSMNLPSVKVMTQAGGKLSKNLVYEFSEDCDRKNIKLFIMYGQTEATARMSYLPPDMSKIKSGSIGIPIPGGSFEIIEEELVYRGDNVSLGYAESFRDLSKGDCNNGVLFTGDMASVDNDGYYYITGRKKRFLKVFGNRVNLDEIDVILKDNDISAVSGGDDDNVKIYIEGNRQMIDVVNFISLRTGLHRSAFKIINVDKIKRDESGKIMFHEMGKSV